jgi:hypothetical protein
VVGVPLEVLRSKFAHMRFEPSGMTNDADIRIAKSIVDYVFRWFGKKFLTTEQAISRHRRRCIRRRRRTPFAVKPVLRQWCESSGPWPGGPGFAA